MMVDQTWTVREVIQKMISKDDVEVGPNWCVMEKLPDMDMGEFTCCLELPKPILVRFIS